MAGEPMLVVDDNPTNLKLIRVLLAEEGYQVRTAADAEEALRVLETFRPRMILMDLQLPGMDGLTLTQKLKADPATKDILILAISAYAMKGDAQRIFAAGCDGYVTKPVDTRLFPATVAGLLTRGGPEQGRKTRPSGPQEGE